MPLTPKFVLTSVNPFSNLWDSENGEYDHYAHLMCYNTQLYPHSDRRLSDQYHEDKAIFVFNWLPTPAPNLMPTQRYKYGCAELYIITNASTEDQYLLYFYLKGIPSAKVAFYINGNLVATEEIQDEEKVAILVPCPGSQQHLYAHMALEGFGQLEFKKIECYVL